MNKQGNTYTFIYSVVLVVVVAALLAIISLSLQPKQQENIKNEKRQNILSSVNIESNADNSEQLFGQYIKDSFIINVNGERVDGNAFDVDIASQYKKAIEERLLPVFVAEVDGAKKYILPLYGAGLWGAIWGYVSLNDDKNTINGIIFDHASETPGLGAEITTMKFRDMFKNKLIFKDGVLESINIKKGGGATGDYEVDAISGGTITSKGVEAMLKNYFSHYEKFLKAN